MTHLLKPLSIGIFFTPTVLTASLVNIDFGNTYANHNSQETGSYVLGEATITANANSGPGMSTAGGQLYFIDNLWSGHAERGPYVVSDNGLGSIDSIPTGGISSEGLIIANGLPARENDANGIYLGLGMSGFDPNPYAAPGTPYNRETAHWVEPIILDSTTTLTFSYQWSAAMGTLADGTDIFASAGLTMSSVFFFDDDLDYSNGVIYEFTSASATYLGAGTQDWITETSSTSLPTGTYYFGFSLNTEGDVSSVPRYITVDGVTIIPEPSSLLFGALGGISLLARLRSRR